MIAARHALGDDSFEPRAISPGNEMGSCPNHVTTKVDAAAWLVRAKQLLEGTSALDQPGGGQELSRYLRH